MEELSRLKGNGSTIIVYEDRVVIKRGAFSAVGSIGEKTFLFSTLGSVVFRKPGWSSMGYIQFIAPGNTSNNHENIGAITDLKGVVELAKDPNLVLLSGRAKEAEEIYNLIQKKIQEYNSRGVNSQNNVSAADELEKFAALKEKGVITAEEFEAKKKQILGS